MGPPPPGNVLGYAVPLNLLLARFASAAVFVANATVYAESFEFELEVRHKLDLEGLLDPLFVVYHERRGGHPPPPEQLRVGVQFADGRKATNLGGPGFFPPPDVESPPPQPVLRAGGGGGGEGRWRHEIFVWPLPPPGPRAFVCESPGAGIELSRVEVDSALLRDAAPRALQLWEEEAGRLRSAAAGARSSSLPGAQPARRRSKNRRTSRRRAVGRERLGSNQRTAVTVTGTGRLAFMQRRFVAPAPSRSDGCWAPTVQSGDGIAASIVFVRSLGSASTSR